VQELIDALGDLFKEAGNMRNRASQVESEGLPAFKRTAEPRIVHPQVFESAEQAEKFAYKSDGRGIAAMADLQVAAQFIVEG